MKSVHTFSVTVIFLLAVCFAATTVTYAGITTGDIITEYESCIEVNENTVILNGELVTNPNGIECGEQSSPTPTPTATPTPTPSDHPSPTPTVSPTPSPTSNPTATPAPTTDNPPSNGVSGKNGHLATNVLCVPYEVHASYEAKESGNKTQDVSVKFKYNGGEKIVKTDNLGLAQVSFPLASEDKYLETEPDRDYPGKSVNIELPDCPASDAGTGGQVLGASTAPVNYAPTGSGLPSALFATLGTILSAAGIYLKRK